MASQGGRVVHQDYIVRQRYSNALPPPPGAPKLLDIPNNGLKLYTMPFYAVPLLREQPVNIEADAFLGMPIDLVGMPGVFEGDESSIHAPTVTPLVDPRDRPLLTPLKQLGKRKNEASDITFLRRTQYTAEERARLEAARGPAAPPVNGAKRLKTDAAHPSSREDPIHILRSVIKGFDIANPDSAYTGPDTPQNVRGLTSTLAERDAWNKPKHPHKPELRPLDVYPVLPELDALPERVGYTVVRLAGHPTDKRDGPDAALQTALLHGLEPAPEDAAEHAARKARYDADPARAPLPPYEPQHDYCLFVPQDAETTAAFARKVDLRDPARDAEGDDEASFRFRNVRRYTLGHQANHEYQPYQEVGLVLHDGPADDADADATDGATQKPKAAYYVPVYARQQLKPRPQGGRQDDAEILKVRVRDQDADEMHSRKMLLRMVDVRDDADEDEDGDEDGIKSSAAESPVDGE